MNPRVWLLSALAVACQGTTAASNSPPQTGAGAAPARGSIAEARPLAAGQSLPEFDVPCESSFYVGPFRFTADPQTVGTRTTLRSTTAEQVCGLRAEWVDGTGTFASTAGVGCAEGDQAMLAEQTFTYSPGNGGSGANPVYLHLERHDPAGCPALRLTLAGR